MVKERHNISIERGIWELSKENGANLSQLVEESIKFRYGKAYDNFLVHLKECNRCGKSLTLNKNLNILFWTQKATDYLNESKFSGEDILFFLSVCNECLEIHNKKSLFHLLPKNVLLEIIRSMNNTNNWEKYVHTSKNKGLVFAIPFTRFVMALRELETKEEFNLWVKNAEEKEILN